MANIDRKIWDRAIEEDFSDEGKGGELLKRIQADFEEGKCHLVLDRLRTNLNHVYH